MTQPPVSEPGAAASLPTGRFLGREVFQQAIRDALAAAAQQNWPEIVLSDANFHDWPLGERCVIASLDAWARAGRRFTVLAYSYDDVVRRHARFVRWRGTWDHLIVCRKARCVEPTDVPSALWSPAWLLHRLDPERCAGVSGADAARSVLLREQLNEWLRSRSTTAFSATTLGL